MNKDLLPNYSEVKDRLRPMPEDADVVEQYEKGFVGAYHDPEADEQLQDEVEVTGQPFDYEDIASDLGIAGAAAGGTYLIYKEVEKAGVPLDCISRISQTCGCCVSRGGQNALLHTICASASQGLTGLPEGLVEATNGGKINPLSNESNYWGRGHSGDGWNASSCVRVLKDQSGLVVRRDLSEFGGPDVRMESTRTCHAYSSWSRVPEKLQEYCHRHPLTSVARIREMEAIVDAIAHGHAVHTDGGEGWARSVDEDGVARRSGHWSHSMCLTAVCMNPEALKKHRTAGLFLIQNSWASFNRNSNAKVYGTSERLPTGSFFAKWEDMRNRSFYAYADIAGFKRARLPDWSIKSKGLV
jgi:hypothetical protein